MFTNLLEDPELDREGDKIFKSKVSFNQVPGNEQDWKRNPKSDLISCLEEGVSVKKIASFLENPQLIGQRKHQLYELRNGKELFSFCVIIFENDNSYLSLQSTPTEFIFNQINLAVNRIVINNAINKQQEERKLLLSLSIAIAKVKDKEQLQLTLSQLLKNYLGFSHTAIAIYNEERNSYNLFSLDPRSKSKNHPEYLKLRSKDFEINDVFTSKISAASCTVCFKLDDYSSKDLPLYLRINKECGIKEFWGLGFRTEEKKLGILTFFFENPTILTDEIVALLTSIGHQISVAVSNIIASEQVNKLLNLKSTMLSFGIELRMTKDINVLSKMIKRQIHELLQVREFAIVSINDDHLSSRLFFYDHEHPFVQAPRFAAILEKGISIKNSFCREIMKSPTPLRLPNNYSIDPLLEELLAPSTEEILVGSRITIAENTVGILLMTCPDFRQIRAERQIFDSFCSQLGIIMNNIQANQDLEAQLKETEKYRKRLEDEKNCFFEEISTLRDKTEIVGNSKEVNDVYKLVSQVSKTSSTVLILGETGTGKELFARAIHDNSARKGKIMIKVNCAAIPANLIESELFGHEKGSFTGATERRIGKFELAHGGTLFLDEVGEMPVELQVKLLRALQEKEIERVGGKSTISVDVRIIAATNRDLEEEMTAGRFRRDLYYRLNIFPISLPALRERSEDVEVLVNHFILKYSKRCGKPVNGISPKALLELKRYDWPGNVRELEHMIERCILLANSNIIRQVPLPAIKEESVLVSPKGDEPLMLRSIDEHEREHILGILNYCRGRIAGKGNAADILGVPPTTLNSKMKRLGIKRGHTS